MRMPDWRVYGRPDESRSPGNSPPELPRVPKLNEDATGYFPYGGLADAVNVAILLGQPLLLTGDPGTGKTRLAESIAHQVFGAGSQPIVFHTKTTTTARDLLYQYDALRHFRESQLRGSGSSLPAESYITYHALGLAILRAMRPEQVADVLPPEGRTKPQRSVLLIDEIDKAPRDVPNDLLDEIDRMRFEVKETGRRFEADPDSRPIVVMTSNSEKVLPEPFLRRCVFYHLDPPGPEQLHEIVTRRLGGDDGRSGEMKTWMKDAIRYFVELRELSLKKTPSTGELLLWLRVLERLELSGDENPLNSDSFPDTLSVLAKTREDRELLLRRARGA